MRKAALILMLFLPLWVMATVGETTALKTTSFTRGLLRCADANDIWLFLGWDPNNAILGPTLLLSTSGAETPLTIQANNAAPSDMNYPAIYTGGGGSLNLGSKPIISGGWDYGQTWINSYWPGSKTVVGTSPANPFPIIGYLGMGTNDPCYPLDIHGTARVHTLIADSNVAYGTSVPSLRICGADFDAEITAIGSTETHLIVGQPVTASQNVTVPQTCTVEVTRAGSIAHGSYSLVFNGNFICDDTHQAFHGATYKVGMNGNDVICPGWWGAVPDDANNADQYGINNALVAANWDNTNVSRARTVKLKHGWYITNAPINQMRAETTVDGEGSYATVISGGGMDDPNSSVVYQRNVQRSIWKNLNISNGDPAHLVRAVFAAGRGGAGSCEINMYDVVIDGYFWEAAMAIYAQEVGYYQRCVFGTTGVGNGHQRSPILIAFSDRHDGDPNRFGYTAQSNTRWTFVDCSVHNGDMRDVNDCLIRLEGYGSDFKWIGGYSYAAKANGFGSTKMALVDIDCTYSSWTNISFDGWRVECGAGSNSPDYAAWDQSAAGGGDCTLRNCTFDTNTVGNYVAYSNDASNFSWIVEEVRNDNGAFASPQVRLPTGAGSYTWKQGGVYNYVCADDYVGQYWSLDGTKPRVSLYELGADQIFMGFDAYKKNGNSPGSPDWWYSSDTGSNFGFQKYGDEFKFGYGHGVAAGSKIGTLEKSATINLTTGVWDFNTAPTVGGVDIRSQAKTTVNDTNTPSGATSKAMPIYDSVGSLIGYIPVYANKW
jgi:hypothetical protein